MAHKITKLKVWLTELDDRAGAMSEKLSVLADAKADLKFVLARRRPDMPGKGILFVSPVQGKKQEEAARSAQFVLTTDLVGVRVEGANKAGLGYRLTDALAKAGINLRGLMASVIGNKFSVFMAFDNDADAERGIKELRKVK